MESPRKSSKRAGRPGWLATPATSTQEHELAADMAAARWMEYQAVSAQAAASAPDRDCTRTVRRLRDELQRIHCRDYFPPAERDVARLAVEALACPHLEANAPGGHNREWATRPRHPHRRRLLHLAIVAPRRPRANSAVFVTTAALTASTNRPAAVMAQ
jgi:hypothetical protein